MSIYSKYNRFGEPMRELFTSTKVLTLPYKITITDAKENVVYRAESIFLPQRAETDIFDAKGKLVAHIERKELSGRQQYNVSMADGTTFELSNEPPHLIQDDTEIDGLGWQLRGAILGLNFELYDQNGQIIAVSAFIAQKVISQNDKHGIDIYKPEYEKTVVAIFVASLHMIRERECAASGSAPSLLSD